MLEPSQRIWKQIVLQYADIVYVKEFGKKPNCFEFEK